LKIKAKLAPRIWIYKQGRSKPGHHGAVSNLLRKFALHIIELSVWNLIQATFLSPKIMRRRFLEDSCTLDI